MKKIFHIWTWCSAICKLRHFYLGLTFSGSELCWKWSILIRTCHGQLCTSDGIWDQTRPVTVLVYTIVQKTWKSLKTVENAFCFLNVERQASPHSKGLFLINSLYSTSHSLGFCPQSFKFGPCYLTRGLVGVFRLLISSYFKLVMLFHLTCNKIA